MASLAHKRFFKNYDHSLLSLKLDQRGFVVGRSRLGITRLGAGGDILEVKDDFISIDMSLSCRVNGGAWIEPEVSSLSIVSRNPALFATLDDYPLELSYDDVVIFSGSVIESTVASQIGNDNTEEFEVQLTARGFELIRNNLPAYGTGGYVWNVIENVATRTPVTEFAEGKVWQRASAITGLPVEAEDDRALVQLEEYLHADDQVSGQQGALLSELAQRAGLLVDVSDGRSVKFRSYQDSPVWEMTDEHLVSGYSVALDRESADAVIVTRKEEETYIRAYRAGSSKAVAETAISTKYNNSWDMQSVAAYAPLLSSPPRYLTSCTLPRTDDLALVSRLPIGATFTHGAEVYGGSVVSMTHHISPERWMIGLGLAGPHLVTRVGSLSPQAPENVAIDLDGNTATLTWDQPALGPAPVNWVVWYQQNPTFEGDENWQIGPSTAPHEDDDHALTTGSVTTSVATLILPGLASDKTYRFTVYAVGTTRSAPSLPVTIDVPPIDDLPGGGTDVLTVTTDDVTQSTIAISWVWTGATPDGYKVGRDGLDDLGTGAYETVLPSSAADVTFDHLLAGRRYNTYVAPVTGGVELGRVQVTNTTDAATVPPVDDPGQPGDPDDPDVYPRRVPLAGFSGLPFNSIVFLPNTTAAGAVTFGNQRTRPMDGLLYFTPRQSWSDLTYRQADHRAWVDSGHLLIVTLPHAPETEGTQMNQRGANNAYRDQQRALGANWAAAGFNKVNVVFRVDWEANGNWYPWNAGTSGGAAALKLSIQNFVTNVRAGGLTNVRFDLCWNNGPSQTGADFSFFPGSQYIDVVAVDSYDWWNAVYNDSDWAAKINRTPGLKTVRDFAVANGIQWALDEGGNIHVSPGGNDNPFYWEKMIEFFSDADNYPSCAWHNTYNHPGAPETLRHDFASNPSSYAEYLTYFG